MLPTVVAVESTYRSGPIFDGNTPGGPALGASGTALRRTKATRFERVVDDIMRHAVMHSSPKHCSRHGDDEKQKKHKKANPYFFVSQNAKRQTPNAKSKPKRLTPNAQRRNARTPSGNSKTPWQEKLSWVRLTPQQVRLSFQPSPSSHQL